MLGEGQGRWMGVLTAGRVAGDSPSNLGPERPDYGDFWGSREGFRCSPQAESRAWHTCGDGR